jgi:hypothetical protein
MLCPILIIHICCGKFDEVVRLCEIPESEKRMDSLGNGMKGRRTAVKNSERNCRFRLHLVPMLHLGMIVFEAWVMG